MQLRATQSTRKRDIKAAFKQLRDECEEDPDSHFFIFIHYSGHGTTTIHFDGEELSCTKDPLRRRAYKSKGLRWLSSVRRLSREELLAVHRCCKLKDSEVKRPDLMHGHRIS